MILDAIEQRNYQRANEIYLQLSIGNQAWPIGVTSIGIHDRSAREALAHHRNVKSQVHHCALTAFGCTYIASTAKVLPHCGFMLLQRCGGAHM